MKKVLAVALLAIVVVAFAAAPAFAEGYNNPTGPGDYTRATGYFSGPHGGYTTTTNKCADCHSTHYASGSYKLLRANSQEAACDFCHGGGGGSTINVQMDNTYNATSVDATTTMGLGTGHTLGFEGNAPADIKPAYSDPEGFACFDCHSPHGNSARIMTTMSNPGRAFAGPGQQGRPTTAVLDNVAALTAATDWPTAPGVGKLGADGILNAIGEWGLDAEYGNTVWYRNVSGAPKFTYRPIWPNGRWLLLKNAHSDAAELGHADTDVAAIGGTATDGVNKYAINWTEPLGPADGTYGGYQDNDNDNVFPFAPASGTSPTGTGGFLSMSEFCVDCHDGTAGVSTQKAEVWRSFDSTYAVAYSHDAQPRH